MKKILISVIIILLLVLMYFALVKGVSLLNIKSINDIKAASSSLDSDFDEANTLSNETYPTEVEELEEAIKNLKLSKKEYESKNLSATEESSLGTVEIKTYKIHYLWTILGNYRKDRGVQSLNLDLKSTQTEDVYDLQFTLIGTYTSITDFIYDIEDDEELNFEIKDFTISSEIDKSTSSTNTTSSNNVLNSSNTTSDTSETTNSTDGSTTTETSDGVTLQAKFTVESVGITLD